MKKTNRLTENEIELVKLLMQDCQSTGDIQMKGVLKNSNIIKKVVQ